MKYSKEVIEEFRKSIPKGRMEEAFKVFYNTKDPIIRENLILANMDEVINIGNYFTKKYHYYWGLDKEEIEDLYQVYYEILIRAVNNYNPYRENSNFRTYLVFSFKSNNNKYICAIIKYFKNNKTKDINEDNLDIITDEIIDSINEKKSFSNKALVKKYLGYRDSYSIDKVEIESHENLEDSIIEKVEREGIIKLINYYISFYKSERGKQVFNEMFNFDDGIFTSQPQVASKLGISRSRVSQFAIEIREYLRYLLENKYGNSITDLLSFNNYTDSFDEQYSLNNNLISVERVDYFKNLNMEDNITEETEKDNIEISDEIVDIIEESTSKEETEEMISSNMNYAKKLLDSLNSFDIKEEDKKQIVYELLGLVEDNGYKHVLKRL